MKERKIKMRRTVFQVGMHTLLLLVVLAAAVQPQEALADSVERRLQVTGTAVISASPDIAYITLGVETQDPSAEKAAQDNANIMAAVLAAMEDLGLGKREVTTSGYNIWGSTQILNRGTEDEQTVTIYCVLYSVTATTENLEQVGEIIDRAVKAGANQVYGINFDVQDKQDMQIEALKLAVKQGIAKAEAMAEAAGVSLGELVYMTESYSTYAPMTGYMALRADAEAATPINPDDVEVRATVELEFAF